MRMSPVEAIENNYICHNGLNVSKNNSIAHETGKMVSFSTAGSSCQDINVDFMSANFLKNTTSPSDTTNITHNGISTDCNINTAVIYLFHVIIH